MGVSASVAVNLLPDLIAALREKTAVVDAVLTAHACKLVSPLYIASLTGRRVYTDEFNADAGWEVPHITLVRDAALFLAAPATANLVGKLAHGIADDLVTTAFLACRAPRVICPAMHPNMWQDSILQDNIDYLRRKRVIVIDPVFGRCASGDEGIGAMAPADQILNAVERALGFVNNEGMDT
jgi:phosphopantothenoylcysteine decarboxylase/phosphopantothenate--cysteine ligase